MRNGAFEIVAKQNGKKRCDRFDVNFAISARNKWHKSKEGVAMEE